MNLCWLILHTSGEQTQPSGSSDRDFVFIPLRKDLGCSPVMFKCQVKGFSSRCKTRAALPIAGAKCAASPHHLLPTWMPCTWTMHHVHLSSTLWPCTSTCPLVAKFRSWGEPQGHPSVVICRYPLCFAHKFNTLGHFADRHHSISQVQGRLICSV